MQNLQMNGYFKVPDWVPSFPRPTKGLGELWREHAFPWGKRETVTSPGSTGGLRVGPHPLLHKKNLSEFQFSEYSQTSRMISVPKHFYSPQGTGMAEITWKAGPPARPERVHPYMQLSPALWDVLMCSFWPQALPYHSRPDRFSK